jgi:hypothetical protein
MDVLSHGNQQQQTVVIVVVMLSIARTHLGGGRVCIF